MKRREFVSVACGAVGAAILPGCGGARGRGRGVIVGGHPWVYAAKLPSHDITPALGEIFADMRYAGLDGIELAHERDFVPTRPLRESLRMSREFVRRTMGF